jgi:hypothetical protein
MVVQTPYLDYLGSPIQPSVLYRLRRPGADNTNPEVCFDNGDLYLSQEVSPDRVSFIHESGGSFVLIKPAGEDIAKRLVPMAPDFVVKRIEELRQKASFLEKKFNPAKQLAAALDSNKHLCESF